MGLEEQRTAPPEEPRELPRSIRGQCIACRRPSLFVGEGDWVTCSRSDCPDPGATSQILVDPWVRCDCGKPKTEPHPQCAWHESRAERGSPGYIVVPADVPHGCVYVGGGPCGVCGRKLAEWEREVLAQQAEPDRPEPVDPADVRVGDVVEVTHSHGHAGLTIVITGEVYKVDDDNPVHPFHLIGYGSPQIGDNTTVRWVRRAEPEADPEQVEALAEALQDTYDGDVARWGALSEHAKEPYRTRARRLIRRGVRVDGGPHDG